MSDACLFYFLDFGLDDFTSCIRASGVTVIEEGIKNRITFVGGPKISADVIH